MALMHVDFFSDVLGKCTQMDVIIPQKSFNQIGMAASGGGDSYPTLYLLHGMSDDHTIWQRRTAIERYVSDLGLAVVMPNGDLSWYTDMYQGGRYFKFFSEELPAVCRDFFPKMARERERTFVAGLSMGGYGAMKLGINASETFGYAASLSGAVDMRQDSLGDSGTFWVSIFGQPDKFNGSENDLYYRAEWLKSTGKPLPKLFMWCGTEDFLYSQNTVMRERLNSLGYDLTYTESPGNHSWNYWDDKIKDVLKWLPLKGNIV